MAFLERFTEHLTSLELNAGEDYGREVVQHERRVEAIIGDFAAALGLSAAERHQVCLASRFHDIGKLLIPSEIILKPASLNAEERDLIERHGMLGAGILSEKGLDLPDGFGEAIRYHHERWDGLGYEGLKGADIPFVSRLLSIVDVFDALTATRIYRPALTEEATLRQMVAQCGADATWFDPLLFRQFLAWRCDVSPTLARGDILDLRDFLAKDPPAVQHPDGAPAVAAACHGRPGQGILRSGENA